MQDFPPVLYAFCVKMDWFLFPQSKEDLTNKEDILDCFNSTLEALYVQIQFEF